MSASRATTILTLAIGASFAEGSAGITNWLEHNVLRRLSISGTRQLGFHMHRVEGDRDAYGSTTYFGQGGEKFTDIGQMTIDGKNVFGLLNFTMTLSDNRFQDPQSRRISIDYSKGPLSVNLGDIHGNLLNTNSFAAFHKQLYGAAAQFKSGRLNVKAVHSESKGSARTVALQGNNSAGPYYLRTNQIIADSEEIRVDGQRLQAGVDYVISYDVGSVTFINRIIAPTSTIVASFEAFGYNANRGTVTGAGATYDLGKFGRLGVTAIEQKTGAAGSLSSRLEEFQGYGSSSSWYTLQFEPLATRPIVVRLNGFIQQPGVHYVFDPEITSMFRFLFDVPPTSLISVTYTPKPTSTVDGDRRVIGFDYRLPLGSDKRNYLSYSQATGELKSALNPMSGTARGLEGSYHWGPFQFRGALRDVPDEFVSVETRGFGRNDRALDLSLTYDRGPLHYGIAHNNSSIGLRRTDSSGNVYFSKSRATSGRAFVNYSPAQGPAWNLEHVRAASRFNGQETKLDTTALSTTRKLGKVNTKLSVEHQTGFGPISNGLTTQMGSVALDTIRLKADYALGDLTLAARTSLSAVEAAGKSGRGNDIGLSAVYNPSDKLNVQASYNVSNSGQLATLGGFQSGIGLGYEGNGFSGGSTGTNFATGITDHRQFTVSTNYKLSPRIALDAQVYQTRSSGSVSTNSETTSYGLGATFDLGRNHLLAMSLDQSKTNFINSINRSDSTSITASFVGSPAGPWAYRLGTSVLLSGGNSPYMQDSVLFDAYLGYRIAPRQRASLLFQTGSTKGYLPQSDAYFAAMYEYQLFQNVALVGSYKIRRVLNSDPLITSGAFKSSGFDLELSFNFGG